MLLHRSYPSHLTNILILLVASFYFCIPVFAQQSILPNPSVKKNIYKKTVAPDANQFVNVMFESVEIVTTADNTHQWQVNVRNDSDKTAKNLKIYVQALGFRTQDKSEVMEGNISLLSGNSTGFVRGPLPSFPGMHQLAIKVAGPIIKVKIPRPFRQDKNGIPVNGLEFNRAWYHVVNGKVRWYLETKPNLYADISAGMSGAKVKSQIRARFKKFCHEEENTEHLHSNGDYIYNTTPIRTGQKYVFSGEVLAGHPNAYDYILLLFQGQRYWIEMAPSFYNNWHKCKEGNYVPPYSQ